MKTRLTFIAIVECDVDTDESGPCTLAVVEKALSSTIRSQIAEMITGTIAVSTHTNQQIH